MIKALTAHTGEIDNTEAALAEIMEQLDLKNNLLKNSIGLITCYSEFIDTGIVKALTSALPFETVGTTTLGNLVPGSLDTLSLTIMVLTSDDVSFSVGLTDSITSDSPEDEALCAAAYEKAAAKLPDFPEKKPLLILSFAPLLMNVSGDFYVTAFDRVSGGIPSFGPVAVDHTSDYHTAQILCNGESYADRCAFVLLSGEVVPHFFIASISSDKFFQDKGLVTDAQGCLLKTVNDVPVVDYLKSLGLPQNEDGTLSAINIFPFVVDYNDGTRPVVRAIFALTPEGCVVCGGNIPTGTTLYVSAFDSAEVLSTTEEALRQALAQRKFDCMILYSCVGRYFAMDYNPLGEMESVQKLIPEGLPYQFTYSGGELCPVHAQGTQSLTNRNHNDSLIICALSSK
ncbi:MAG: FIST C-terminal domain-containing protein [Synergistaceae bacterium]|jgi:hypothetical protein|nr:FIST C-terminal domain-containing protein [Synergistaceae bacterium]